MKRVNDSYEEVYKEFLRFLDAYLRKQRYGGSEKAKYDRFLEALKTDVYFFCTEWDRQYPVIIKKKFAILPKYFQRRTEVHISLQNDVLEMVYSYETGPSESGLFESDRFVFNLNDGTFMFTEGITDKD